VKLHECQYGTKQSVLGGRGWGEEELVLLKFAMLPNVKYNKIIYDYFLVVHRQSYYSYLAVSTIQSF